MKKIVFSDIDRTLAIKEFVSEKNIDAIKKYQELGNLFVLVSGRVIPYVSSLSKKIKASKYVICTNGGVVYDYANNKVIYKLTIPFKVVEKLYNLACEKDLRIIIGGVNTTFVNKIKYPQRETIISDFTKTIYEENPITQVTISHPDKNVMHEVINEVQKFSAIEIINRHRSLYDESFEDGGNIWIDIATKNVSKGIAIKKLAEYLNVSLNDTVRIGDDLNDLPMFLEEGLNVAVENAIPDLKNKADFITASCDNDGVAMVLEKIIDKKI